MSAMFSAAVHENPLAGGSAPPRRFTARGWRSAVSMGVVLLSVIIHGGPVFAQSPGSVEQGDMGRWLAATAHQEGAISPGTRITLGNWRQYRQYMPMGMQELFEGQHFWRMPKDVEMDIGPTIVYLLPAGYTRATEKHGAAVRVVHLPNGRNDIANYAGGEPFPNPGEPDKGYKLLVDLWFAYLPHLIAGTPENSLHSCVQDRFRSISCLLVSYVYRQTAYNTDPGVARDDPRAKDIWFTEWAAVEAPEQSKYTAQLTLFFKDNQRDEELYLFVPALRRSLRLGIPARCTQVTGTDYLQDDYKNNGFNGGIALFDATFLGHRKILALTGNYPASAGDFPNHYYMPLGWPMPSWANWQLRDVDVIDVRRVPSERSGYCYGSRIIYEDSHTHYALWEDLYDAEMRLWKLALVAQRVIEAPLLGFVPGPVTSCVWDIQNDHMTCGSTQDKYGHDLLVNSDVPPEYQDFNKYATPGGLLQIMK